MGLLFIHNPQSNLSHILLAGIPPSCLVIEHNDALAGGLYFRASPSIYFVPDGFALEPSNAAAWLEEEEITQENINAALAQARYITLEAPKASIALNETVLVTAVWRDLQDAPVTPPEDTIFVVGGQYVTASDHQLAFSASTPGIYVIRTAQRYWLPGSRGVLDGRLEVEVHA